MGFKTDPESWRDVRHRRGAAGEKMALRHLERTGWEVLNHRFKMGRLEIDLVARKGTVVAFVEVKTRFGDGYGSPVEAVTWAKRREITRVAQAWIDRYGGPSDTYRMDVIGVTVRGGRWRVEHVEDAFRPGWR